MKIGIMTMYHENFNFGGQLQAMALQRAVTLLGHECHVIDYAVGTAQNSTRKLFHTNFKELSEKVKRKALYTLKSKTDKAFRENVALRRKRFRDFIQSIPHTDQCNPAAIKALFADKFDVLITGSDQVWNPNWWDSAYFLDFASPETKKVAYSVSLNVDKISTMDSNYIREKTADFAAISLREEGSKRMLTDVISQPIFVTLDPTLLFQRDFWDTVAVNPSMAEPYALIYFPGGKNESELRIWHKFCEQIGVKLLAFPHFQGKYNVSDEIYADIRDYSSGPAEFIGLIKHAKYVLTGSFHATVFSIMFNKQFVSFRKQKEHNTPAEMLRNGSLLKTLGLEERLVRHDWIPQLSLLDKPIDYVNAEQKLSILRKESLEFLKNALDRGR